MRTAFSLDALRRPRTIRDDFSMGDYRNVRVRSVPRHFLKNGVFDLYVSLEQVPERCDIKFLCESTKVDSYSISDSSHGGFKTALNLQRALIGRIEKRS